MRYDQCVNLLPLQPEQRLQRPFEGILAWTKDTADQARYRQEIPPAARAELEALAESLRRETLPTYLLAPEHFPLEACRAMMAQARRELNEGLGFAVLSGFPLDAMSSDEVRAAFWVLGRLLSPPVASKWDGTVLYDITDTGEQYRIGVRGSLTNKELEFHSDNTFAAAPPDFISLLCLHPATKGGESRVCSFYSLHNALLARHPRLLDRLYGPYYFDRQAEHPPDEPKVSISRPITFDGERLRGRLSYNVILQGYQLMEEALDSEGLEALDAAYAVMNEPESWVEHTLRRGEIQLVNNRAIAHFRAAFHNAAPPAPGRHLLRLWHRDSGRPFFNG